jgi:DNA topoisomerase I
METAEEAGLCYVSDESPGYTRRCRGKKFVYFDTEGKAITNERRILRLNRLAIPSACTDTWICHSPHGHLQATGRDDHGRKQYRYHERWWENGTKTSTRRWSSLAKQSRRYGAGSSATFGVAVFRRRKFSPLLSSFWRKRCSQRQAFTGD